MAREYGVRQVIRRIEQASLSFNKETVNALRQLRNLGLLLAVDDFSMGQTSIHYIKDNLFDIIKLDGSLIRELFTHQNSREIISSIVQLADTLHLSVIAEFVETEAQRDTLHELGCDIYQGYLYSPAVFLSNHDSAKAGQPLREKSVKRNASRSTITSNPAKTLMRR